MSTDQQEDDSEQKVNSGLRTAFLLNLAFTIIEIVGGLLTNSIAILTDALHDAGDCASLGLSWFLQRFSTKEGTSTYTYGYRRFSVLGALITGAVLVAGLTFILWQAVQRLLSPQEVNAPYMIVLAVIGIVMNGAATLKLKGGSSLNEKVVGWHLLEDTLGWIAVLIGSIIMTIWNLPIVDPLLSIGISLFVLWNISKELIDVFKIFLQRKPDSFEVEQFEREITTERNVHSLHNTRSWSTDGERHVFSTHLVARQDTSREQLFALKQRMYKKLEEQGFVDVAIEIEFENEPCAAHAKNGQEQHN